MDEHRTGHPQVDDVLATLESLAGLPAEQHVEVFESAHLGLRAALSDVRPNTQG